MELSAQPEPQSKPISHIISNLAQGHIKVPMFQRNFVWDMSKTAQLLDSVIKGYPIGTFTLWQTHQRMASVRNIGGVDFPETPAGYPVQYVLDGQQRITSLYAGWEGLSIMRAGKKRPANYNDIIVDLIVDSYDDPIVTLRKKAIGKKVVSIREVLSHTYSFSSAKALTEKGFTDDEIQMIGKYKERFNLYNFSFIVMTTDSVDCATEVFTRMNTAGKTLTVFEIMCAKTYDEKNDGFDMNQKWGRFKRELEKSNYETINHMVVLRLLSLILSPSRECKSSTMLGLLTAEIAARWDDAISAIKGAIDFLRSVYQLRVSALLPYDSLIIPFAYYIYHNGGKPPVGDHARCMSEFFWRASLSDRYSSGNATQLSKDTGRVNDLLDGITPDLSDIKVKIHSPEHLIKTAFNPKSSVCKALLLIMAQRQPRGFANNDVVNLDNTHLQKRTGKNYHHFFPINVLQKRDVQNENSMMNITLISEGLNKSPIMAKAPSEYISHFEKNGDGDIHEQLDTHFIDTDEYDVKSDVYEAFLHMRANLIFAEIEKRINAKLGDVQLELSAQ